MGMLTLRPHPKLIGASKERVKQVYEAEIEKIPLSKILRDIIMVGKQCGQDVDADGFAIEPNGEVAVSLPAMAHIASVALRLASEKGFKIDKGDEYVKPHKIKNTLDESFKYILPLCLIYNSFPAMKFDKTIFDNTAYRKLQLISPIVFAIERYTITLRHLMARCAAWYRGIPSKYNIRIPTDVDEYILNQYGINGEELIVGNLSLYAAGMNNHVIVKEIFRDIRNPEDHPARKLLRYSKTIADYKHDTIVKMSLAGDSIHNATASLIKYPIVNIADELWSIPIPRLLLNTLVETIHWNLYDHFLEVSGNTTNSYTKWFGKVFETYVVELMKSSFTRKMQSEYIYNEKDKSPDLMEIHTDKALLVEVKARRPSLIVRRFDSPDAVAKVEEFIKETLGQVVNFIDKHCNDGDAGKPHFRGIRDYIVIVVTPEWWPVNPLIEIGFADSIIKKCLDDNSHINSIRPYFVPVTDLEIIPRLKGHQFAYNLFDAYLKSNLFPNSSFSDYIKLKSGINDQLINPYVADQFDSGFKICEGYFNG